MELKFLFYMCIALIIEHSNGNESAKVDAIKQPEGLFGEYCFRSVQLVDQMKKELEEKEKLIVKLQNDFEKLQLSTKNVGLKNDLIESYKYTIESQNLTITQLNNRIAELKIVNRIAINLQAIRNDLINLTFGNTNNSLQNQEVNLSDAFFKELERKNITDELLETQNQLSECNSNLEDQRGKATNCIPFGYKTGIQQIQFPGIDPFSVLCNGEIAGPGWLVIHQRSIGDIDFYRTWSEYKSGFGDMSGDFFIGLEKLYRFTNYESYELFVQLEKFNGSLLYAHYDDIVIGSELERFALKKLGKMTGNADDWLRNQETLQFSTFDQDNDNEEEINCAEKYHGGWWYKKITGSNLNGKLLEQEEFSDSSMHWGESYALKSAKMLIRPKN